jgi:hypothetical protein
MYLGLPQKPIKAIPVDWHGGLIRSGGSGISAEAASNKHLSAISVFKNDGVRKQLDVPFFVI